MNFEQLVRSCLYNWLGYGNINGEIWFIGTEEGGAEIWRQKTKTLEESLICRSGFTLAMDFTDVWENIYEIPLEDFKGPCVWRYIAAFILSFKGKKPDTATINNFVFENKLLGSKKSDHFMCEVLPLPKRKKDSIEDYKMLWRNITEYHEEVLPRRFELIKNTISKNTNVKLIVSYESLLSDIFIRSFWNQSKLIKSWVYKKEKYRLYEIEITPNRKVLLITTPFFGNGCISYDGLVLANQEIKNLIN